MITRIVRMEFDPAKVDNFLEMFTRTSPLIRNFEGVSRLELHRDATQPNVFYTLSEWENESQLEKYRQSALFNEVWSQTKTWFSGKPQAFSLLREMVIGGQK